MAWLEGNRVTLLEGGGEYFPALIAAIDAARFDVHLESYIYEADDTGRAIAHALMRAARRGVRVKVLLDGFGARGFPQALAVSLEAAGVLLLYFRPELSTIRLRRYRLRRMHRKLAVIDAAVAFVGGINIIDDRNVVGGIGYRHDYAVEVRGPLLGQIYPAVRRLWWLVRWSRMGRRPRAWPSLTPAVEPAGAQRAEFLQRDNVKHRRDIEDAYLAAIQGASREIIIANAYFLPGRRFRQALVEAAGRGVRVVLILQGRTDHKLFHLAERALYGHFLDHGIEVHEYHASELHAKAAVIDGIWATVGSSNIDPFSLLLAREANVAVEDLRFAGELRSSLRRALEAGTRKIHARAWRRVPWYRRLVFWALFGLYRALMGFLGLASRE